MTTHDYSNATEAERERGLLALGLTVESVFVPWTKSRSYDPKEHGSDNGPGTGNRSRLAINKATLNWRVTLKKDGREVLTTDYTQGLGWAPSYKNWNTRQHGSKFSLLHYAFLKHEVETGKTAVTVGHMDGPATSGKPIPGPSLVEVVSSLLLDASAIDHAKFESWAHEYGYDTDSRKAEATYRACLEVGLALRAGLGDDGLSMARQILEGF